MTLKMKCSTFAETRVEEAAAAQPDQEHNISIAGLQDYCKVSLSRWSRQKFPDSTRLLLG